MEMELYGTRPGRSFSTGFSGEEVEEGHDAGFEERTRAERTRRRRALEKRPQE